MMFNNFESVKLEWKKILQANTIIDFETLFILRHLAFLYSHDNNIPVRTLARSFILATMIHGEEIIFDSSNSKDTSPNHNKELPKILSKRSAPDINALVCFQDSTEDINRKTLHEIHFYNQDTSKNFKFSHKYNLTELSKQWNIPHANTYIRQIGDDTLHKEAQYVTNFTPDNISNIENQLQILKNVLSLTGGVGIAANQCLQIEAPLKLILAGVDYSNPEHVVKAITRYPTALFPQVKLFINPEIMELGNEDATFPEGCLSVQGALRASVKRPNSVSINYSDIDGKSCKVSLIGSDARVMLHEIDHINNGTVYIQRIIKELTIEQLKEFRQIINSLLISQRKKSFNTFIAPTIAFLRDKSGNLFFDSDELFLELSKMPFDTLKGILSYIEAEIIDRK